MTVRNNDIMTFSSAARVHSEYKTGSKRMSRKIPSRYYYVHEIVLGIEWILENKRRRMSFKFNFGVLPKHIQHTAVDD